jgi:3-methyladenine DNA glycosylase/8-oxoguanine DNA glycosylase
VPTVTLEVDGPLDLVRTLAPLVRGNGDRTIRVGSDRVWWATCTSSGAVTVAIRRPTPDALELEAFGPGAEEGLARVPGLLGLGRADLRVGSLVDVEDRRIADLARRFPGVRITRTAAVMDALIPAIIEQKVTGTEARRAWQGLVRAHGEDAPAGGPGAPPLRLPPTPAALARLPYYAYHPFGVERRRADVVRAVASRADWFEAIADLPLEAAYARLRSVPGVGPWTAAEVAVRALGDPDAVSVGDYHLPNRVAFALAGESRADDARMLELLEPYLGRRALVIRALELGGPTPPKYGPRFAPRRIEDL